MALNFGATFSASFTGINGAGAISISGLKVGDLVLNVFCPNVGEPSGDYETVVTVADELQQLGVDNSAQSLTVAFFRPTC